MAILPSCKPLQAAAQAFLRSAKGKAKAKSKAKAKAKAAAKSDGS